MPLYEFYCSACNNTDEELRSLGTTASRCQLCGERSFLIPSVPAPPRIRHGATYEESLAPFSPQSCAVSPEEDNRTRVYDFEFGSYEKRKLGDMAEKELQSGVFDGYSV